VESYGLIDDFSAILNKKSAVLSRQEFCLISLMDTRGVVLLCKPTGRAGSLTPTTQRPAVWLTAKSIRDSGQIDTAEDFSVPFPSTEGSLQK